MDNSHHMSETNFHTVVAVSDPSSLPSWLALARAMSPANTHLELRALVTIPAGHSENVAGPTVRRWWHVLADLQQLDRLGDVTANIIAEHKPMTALQKELRIVGADLLLVQWAGPFSTGPESESDLFVQDFPFDVVLLARFDQDIQNLPSPVLLPLRGGPNLSIGLRAARALAANAGITLLNVSDSQALAANLDPFLSREPNVTRTRSELGEPSAIVLQESLRHKAIVFGSGRAIAAVPPLLKSIFKQTTCPIALVRAGVAELLNFQAPTAPV